MRTKKCFSLLMALVLVIGLMPAPSLAADGSAELAPAAISTDLAAASADRVSTWGELQNALDVAQDGDTVTLSGDVTASNDDNTLDAPYGKSITLDLNGHAINRALTKVSTDAGSAIRIPKGGTLTVCDSAGGGKITGGYATVGGGINNEGTLYFQSGTVTGNSASVQGAGINNQGTMVMSGGTVSLNTAYNALDSSVKGGGICNEGTLTVQNASVVTNLVKGATSDTVKGGGIYNEGTLSVSGATISSNTVVNVTSGTAEGGGVYTTKEATLSGATIQGNVADDCGGGVLVGDGTTAFNIEGTIVVDDNKATTGADVYLSAAGQAMTVAGTLAESTSIGVTLASESGVFTSGLKDKGTASNFFTDEANVVYLTDDGEAAIRSGWAELQAQIDAAGTTATTIKLDRDWTAASSDTQLNIPSGANITIDLNSHRLNRYLGTVAADGSVINVASGASLTIMDSSESGIGYITGGYAEQGGGIYSAGALTIENGIIGGNTANNGGGIYIASGSFAFKGGNVEGNTAVESGGGILVEDGVASFSVQGNPHAVLNTAPAATNIYLKGESTVITVTGDLGDADADEEYAKLGVSLEKSNRTFTSGLNSQGSTGNFLALAPDRLETDSSDEARMVSGWAALQSEINEAGFTGATITITLEHDWTASSNDKQLEIPESTNVTIDLNGYMLDRNLTKAIEDGSVIHVPSGATLTIKDSSEAKTGYISGGYAEKGGGGINNQGTLTLESGSIAANKASGNGGGVLNQEGAKFTIKGGSIYQNRAATSGGGIRNLGTLVIEGGTVSHNKAGETGGGVSTVGTLTMTGGTVEYNTAATSGGGIRVAEAEGTASEATISGGTITGNTAKGENGGGISVSGASATLSLQGGTIQGNTASQQGGGIHIDSTVGAFNVQGAPVVTGNSVDTTSGTDIFLASGKVMTVTGTFGDDASLAVCLENGAGVVTSGYKTHNGEKDPVEFFDAQGFDVGLNGDGEVEFASTWPALQALIDNAQSGATIKLEQDYTAGSNDANLLVKSGQDITLDLNGHTIDRNLTAQTENGFVILVQGKLTVTDGSDAGTGAITGGYSGDGGGVYIDKGGTLNLNGGSIRGNQANFGGGIVVWGSSENPGTLNVNGGAVENNHAMSRGGGIYSAGYDGDQAINFVHINGGAIQNNTCDGAAGGIAAGNCTDLYLHGGTITGNSAYTAGGLEITSYARDSVFISGSPIITDNTASGKYPNLTYLCNGSSGYFPYIQVDGDLTGAKIGISTAESLVDKKYYGTFAAHYSEYNDQDPAEIFFPEGTDYVALNGSGGVKMCRTDSSFIGSGDQVNIDYASLTSSNWMSGISGERYLNEVCIPCTHDTGCRDVYSSDFWFASFAETQYLYIDEQLENGIRKLDLRLNNWHESGSNWYSVSYKDDAENLWICHGKEVTGIYWAKDADGTDLSLAKVLDKVKAFLEANPTECVILSFEAEINHKVGPNRDGDEDIVWDRLNSALWDLAREDNPSTGKPYLYLEENVKEIATPYTKCPQMKDCRGQVVILSDSSTKDKIGGLVFGDVGINVHSEGNNKCTASEKVERVHNFYLENSDNPEFSIAPIADDHSHSSELYYVGTTTTGPDGTTQLEGVTPKDIAEYVHNHLWRWHDVYDSVGIYRGWVRIDGATQETNDAIWRMNFPSTLETCALTVEPGIDSTEFSGQVYGLQKGATITIPDCIFAFDWEEMNCTFGGWEAETASGTTTVQAGDSYRVAEDVTFKPILINDTPVTVKWHDGDDFDKLRPEELTLNIYSDDSSEPASKVKVKGAENWKGTISGVVKKVEPTWSRIIPVSGHEQGQDREGEYRYEVTLDSDIGYVISLYHTPDSKIAASGEVAWDDDSNRDGLRPDSVDLNLLADGEEKESLTVTAQDSWKWNLGDLPEYVNGAKVTYTLTEEAVDGYVTSIEGFNVANSHTPATVSISGNIAWDDNDDAAGRRPDSVTIRLLGDDVEVASQKVGAGAAESWAWMFDGLYKYKDGKEIGYTVAEDPVVHYLTTVSYGDDSVVVTNAYTHQWDDHFTVDVEPTCTQEGSESIHCSLCGETKDARAIPALGHNWSEPTYTWAEDNSTVTAKRVCTRDTTHVESETVKTTSEVTKEPSDIETGERTYTATFKNASFATQKRTEEIPARLVYYSVDDDLKWNKGNGESLVVRFKRTSHDDATFSRFKGITIDGTSVGANYYTTKPGSVILSVHSEYLETLGTGKHTLTAQFDDGSSSMEFTILDDQGDSPGKKSEVSKASKTSKNATAKTGDMINVGIVLALVFMSIILLTFAAYMKRKRQ